MFLEGVTHEGNRIEVEAHPPGYTSGNIYVTIIHGESERVGAVRSNGARILARHLLRAADVAEGLE